MSNSIFINAQIAPLVDGRLAARRVFRVGDNKKSHVQINHEGARKSSKQLTFRPFNSLPSRRQLRSDWILEKAALKMVYLSSWGSF